MGDLFKLFILTNRAATDDYFYTTFAPLLQ